MSVIATGPRQQLPPILLQGEVGHVVTLTFRFRRQGLGLGVVGHGWTPELGKEYHNNLLEGELSNEMEGCCVLALGLFIPHWNVQCAWRGAGAGNTVAACCMR